MTTTPWRGLYTATALPFTADLEVDYDAYAEHVAWLAASGTDGVCPNGSLGEYQTLTDAERARVVEVAAEARPDGFGLMPGVAAYGSRQTQQWVEQAAEAGAESVLLLPPNVYRADRESVVDHYRVAASVGLPIVAYNNPIDTKVDLSPDLLAELHGEGLIVAVKEFTGDVRRAWEIAEVAPGLDLLIGSDDVVVELGVAGAVGWICGYSNALPRTCVELLTAATSGDPSDLAQALPIYRNLHSLLRWDARTEFVQAIKLSMDVVGRRGGVCRAPRRPLSDELTRELTAVTEAAVALGYK